MIYIIMTLAWMILEKVSGLHSTHIDKQQYLTLLYIIPSIFVYLLALSDKKKNFYSGKITFMDAFLSGIIMTMIITFFSPFTQWIISYVISPEYFPNVIAYCLKTGYFKTQQEAEAFFNFKNFAYQSTLWAFMMGVTTSAIIAFFIKSKR